MSRECRSCSREASPDDHYCAGCGSPLEDQGNPTVAAVSTSSSIDEQQIVDLARHSKIDAIKRYRETHKVGLAEAKQAVENLMVRHGIIAGGRSQPSGCLSALIIVAAGLGFFIAGIVQALS